MDIEVKAWLYDIMNAINEIEGFFVDRQKDFIAYQNDLRTKRAVERNIENHRRSNESYFEQRQLNTVFQCEKNR